MKKWMGGLVLVLVLLTGCSSAAVEEVNFDMLLSPFDHMVDVHDEAVAVVNTSVTEAVYEPPLPPPEPEPEGIIPVRIEIPAINVDTDVINVGILDNGEMGVPEDDSEVGWYELGYLPGMNGNSVMAGHEDNWLGPAVFFDLPRLKEGDKVYVYGEDGTKLTFEVFLSEEYITEESPLEQIFGPADRPQLNLITCAGPYSRVTHTSPKRLVVYTKLVDEEQTTVATNS